MYIVLFFLLFCSVRVAYSIENSVLYTTGSGIAAVIVAAAAAADVFAGLNYTATPPIFFLSCCSRSRSLPLFLDVEYCRCYIGFVVVAFFIEKKKTSAQSLENLYLYIYQLVSNSFDIHTNTLVVHSVCIVKYV